MRTLFLLALSTLVNACSTVRFEDDGDASVGTSTGGVTPEVPTSVPPGCESSARLDVRAVTSGAMVGDRVHLRAEVAGTSRYLVLDLAGDGRSAIASEAAYPVAGQSADWVPIGGARYARLADTRLAVTDASDPSAPTVVSVRTVDLIDDPAATTILGAEGDIVHLCGYDAEIGGLRSGVVDVSRPAFPTLVTWDERNHCGAPGVRAVARDGLVASSGRADPEKGEDGVSVFDLYTGSSAANHSWNTVGVHHYGDAVDVMTDGELVVATLENPSYVFLYFRGHVTGPEVVYVSFGSGEKKLVDVIDGVAYLAVPADGGIAIVARDVFGVELTHEVTIPEEATRVVLTGARGNFEEVRAIARPAGSLLVTDADGVPFLVPLGGAASVAPLDVHPTDACRDVTGS